MSRLFQTLRYLRPRQIAYQLFYRFTGRLVQNGARAQVRSSLGAKPVLPPLADGLKAPANALPVRFTEAGFCFLNRSLPCPSFGAIDWNYPAFGKLWTYNLNYFEYLRQPGLDPDTGEQLIGAWVTGEDTHKDGWEPYPTSLRLVNWLQFYRSIDRPVPARIHGSIRRQYVSLWRKIEYHLGGNHLLENALALALTSRYLNDPAGQKKADKILLAELNEQYLPDGSHYERTVMYHLILLWRQLDVYSWLGMLEGWDDKFEVSSPAEALTALRASLRSQLTYAAAITTPDGRYPHFNDSTYGIAPEWPALRAYAKSLGLEAHAPEPGTHSPKPPSHYHRWLTERLDIWMDAAPIGPDDMPGHAHADSLTFVLHADGQPLLIDPAISTYEKNDRRAYERSTAAHNTVTVGDDLNSSDVWGGFRVGRRARTAVTESSPGRLVARHNGFPGTTHERSFHLDASAQRFAVNDVLSGSDLNGTLRLHFAPGIVPDLQGLNLEAGPCRLSFVGADSLELFDYQAAVGWNELRDGVGLRVRFRERMRLGVELATDH